MTERNQVYKCNVCGNIIEVLHEGADALVCCGQPMELLKIKTQDEGLEKHVPVVEKSDKGIKIKVGSVPHPMEDKHFIEWIQAIDGDTVHRAFLKPGQAPEAEFPINNENVVVREHCNIHGLWRN